MSFSRGSLTMPFSASPRARGQAQPRWCRVGVEREQEPGYGTAVYVHRQGQPRAGGSPLRPPLIMSTRVCPSGEHRVTTPSSGCRTGRNPLRCTACTFCRSGHGVAAPARLFVCGMPRSRVEARRLETLPPTLMLNSVEQYGVSKILTHEIELLDTCASAKAVMIIFCVVTGAIRGQPAHSCTRWRTEGYGSPCR
jgi:hypothetical protein